MLTDIHLLILDVELLPLRVIFLMIIFEWRTGLFERLSLRLLFFLEFGDFSLELPAVDPIHHYHQASSGC